MSIANPYAQEAKERWGDTDAYKISTARAAKYSEADWEVIKAEQQAAVDLFIAAMNAGLSAHSDEAAAAAEAHRLGIDKWFYPCSHEMQSGLAEMYIADERFAKYYNEQADGLAKYVHDAIIANALKHL
ncbi:MAG: hypothetical protein RLZZ330_1154 [Actinomycetota bacterium]|jgi:hypothetical protein